MGIVGYDGNTMADDPTDPTNVFETESPSYLATSQGIYSEGSRDIGAVVLKHMEVPIRYLSDIRRERLVRGLSERIRNSRLRLQSATVEIAQSRATLEQDFTNDEVRMGVEQSNEYDSALTEWDRAREANYYQSDITTLASVRREFSGVETYKIEHRDSHSREVNRYKETRQKLDAHYEEIKPKPARRLEKFVAYLLQKQNHSQGIIEEFRTFVVSRSLKVPTVKSEEIESEGANIDQPLPETNAAASEMLVELIKEMQSIYESVQRKRLIKWLGSGLPWLSGLIPGIGLAWLAWKLMPANYIAIASVGFATLAVVPVALMVFMVLRAKALIQAPYRNLLVDLQKLQLISRHAKKVAEKHCKDEQARMLNEYQVLIKNLELEHQQKLGEIDRRMHEGIYELKAKQTEIRKKAAIDLTNAIQSTDQSWQPKIEQLIVRQRQDVLDRRSRLLADRESLAELEKTTVYRLSERMRSGIEQVTSRVDAMRDYCFQRFPDWSEDCWERGDWPRSFDNAVWPIGSCTVPIDNDETRAMPITYDLLSQGVLAIESDSQNRDRARDLVQSVLARAFTSLPMGNLQATIIDPEGLGRDYSWLMHLADADPRLVNNRVWTQNAQISEQLSLLAYQNEEIIQQRLRDRYQNILDYNRDAGPMAEPMRLVVWANFPFGLEEQSWKSLCALLQSGARCGIGIILTLDPNHPWPVYAKKETVLEAGVHIRMSGQSTVVVHPYWGQFGLQLSPAPQSHVLITAMEHCARAALEIGKIEVPFDTIAAKDDELGKAISGDGLVVPLGVAGVGRTLSMRLGGGTSQHVLVAGKTGSGKSSLLHTLITSAALKYSPEQLRMVLLDFKKGVEFQVYSHGGLPHAEIIGIESRREFGLSSLEYLDKIMQRRGEMFREAGVQDIPTWTRKRPNQPMPRVLVVIDEFQEMFVEDDKLSQQSSMLLDRIVRQGRSFGIHMVLASQTLGGSYSLPRTTLAQMAVRIALQCDGSDAMLILGEDNLAASRLRHSGQAIYNDAGGRVESNQPFQVAYLTSKTHGNQISRVPHTDRPDDPSTNMLGRQIVFEGHKPAIWSPSDIERGIKSLAKMEQGALPLVLGESLSIEPAITRVLNRQAGRNMAMVGSDDRLASHMIVSLVRGWTETSARDHSPTINYLDGARPEDQHAAGIRPWLDGMNKAIDETSGQSTRGNSESSRIRAITGEVRDSESIIQSVYTELERRMADPQVAHPSQLLIIANLARFRDLRKVDEFAFGSSSDSAKVAPDVAFGKILREGPTFGIFVLVWADSAGTLSRWLGRQGLRDLEVRILMQMSVNDSNTLIDSSVANKLEPHALIYYDETDSKVTKFRPYQWNRNDTENV